jgi:uncharacterized membrane protein SirB2
MASRARNAGGESSPASRVASSMHGPFRRRLSAEGHNQEEAVLEYYLPIKHLHVFVAGLSLALFVLRAFWSVRASPILQARWVRVAPHLVDTLLLVLGLVLMAMLSLWPHRHPWLAAKLIALLAYIGLGTVAIKRGRSPQARAVAALAAVATFAYMLGAALRHSPLSWLA